MAAWGLIALLVAVFPANIHMAVHPELYPDISRIALLMRLPLQGLLEQIYSVPGSATNL